MQHFFVDPACLARDPVELPATLAHQLSRVLRAHSGEHIGLLDDSGCLYEVELDSVHPRYTSGHIVSRSWPNTEPRVHLTLCQALLRERKFDWVLQKGTELGVSTFIPLLTERTQIPGDERLDAGRYERWQRIVTEAAEQSGRVRLPHIDPAASLSQSCQYTRTATLDLIASTEGERRPLGDVLSSSPLDSLSQVRLFIGPEGGFTPAEVELARAHGSVPISLGPRILRTETAGLVALAIVTHALGEF